MTACGLFSLVTLAVALAGAAEKPAFPLKVSSDSRYLVDSNQKPFLIHGDSPWELSWNVTSEDAVLYLNDREKKGFNSLLIDVLPYTEWSDHLKETDRAGNPPFHTPGDFATPNEAYFRHLDWVIDECARRGMLTLMVAADLGHLNLNMFSARGGMWWPQYETNGPRKCYEYGRFLGRRYSSRRNILWILGGDRDPGKLVEHVNEMARGLKETAPDHLVTYHAGAKSSTLFFHTAPWLDLNTSYGYEDVQEFVPRDARLAPRKPTFLAESGYEGESNDGRGGTPQRVRRQAWVALLSGACGHLYGSVDWKMLPGWKQRLDWPGVVQMNSIKRLFESFEWHRLEPDLGGRLLVAGRGAGADFAGAAALPDGALAIVYLPSSRRITLDMSQLAAKVEASWLDPTNGDSVPARPNPGAKGPLSAYTPPAQNAAHEGDWVLVPRAPGR